MACDYNVISNPFFLHEIFKLKKLLKQMISDHNSNSSTIICNDSKKKV
jgi:hypothetical protein